MPRFTPTASYPTLVSEIGSLLERSRSSAARVVNSLMTATYWEIGRRIVEYEQRGEKRAEYGTALLKRLAADLTERVGRGFSERNLEHMRRFYELWPIPQTLSANSERISISQTASAKSSRSRKNNIGKSLPCLGESPGAALGTGLKAFPLPWSHYAREHWTHPDENPPVGFILCSSADAALVRYTLDALPNKVMAREYKLALPDTKRLEQELTKTRKRLEQHRH